MSSGEEEGNTDKDAQSKAAQLLKVRPSSRVCFRNVLFIGIFLKALIRLIKD
jgi:hypothetical protein